MITTTVLLVEDEKAIREMLTFSLPAPGYKVLEAVNAQQTLEHLRRKPDIILLDWMLPGISGIEILKIVRQKDTPDYAPPVIMLTARSQEEDKIQGFQSGADDYITKPFSTRELKARMAAMLRRSRIHSHDTLRFLNLSIDLNAHQASIDSTPLKLGPTEFELLHLFIAHQNRVYSRAQLLDLIWGSDGDVLERTVDVHILRLRKALAQHGYAQYLQTVWAVGYRFSEQTQGSL